MHICFLGVLKTNQKLKTFLGVLKTSQKLVTLLLWFLLKQPSCDNFDISEVFK